MGRLVEGQVTADGKEGQVTTGGFEGQAQGTTDTLGGPEGQVCDNDVDGQENDARPYGESRPAVNTQGVQPDARAKQGPLPPSTRRVAGSVKR